MAYLHFDAVEARIAALEAIDRQRGLNAAEAAELDNLLYRRRLSLLRLDRQINAAAAKLHRLQDIRERVRA